MIETKEFLSFLFDDDDIINFRLIDNKKIINRWWTIAEINYDFLKQQNEAGYNIYFGGNPRKEKGVENPKTDEERARGKGDDSVEICRCCFVDFDHKDFPEILWENFFDHIKSLIKDLPIPMFKNLTGGGYHCWWRLSRFLVPDEWKYIQERLIATLGSDKKIKNPERIMRLPGFLNTKRSPLVKCVVNESNLDITKISNIKAHLVDSPVDEESETKTKTKKKKHLKYNLDFNKLNYKKVLADIGKKWELSADKKHFNLNCIIEDGHANGDKNPSFPLAFIGEHCGTGKCWSCDTSYTIIEVILATCNKELDDEDARFNIIWRLNNEYPGFLIHETVYLQAATPHKSRKKFLEHYFYEKSESGEYMFTLLIVDGYPQAYSKEFGVYEILQPAYLEHLIDNFASDAKTVNTKITRKKGEEIKCFSESDFNPDNKKVSEIYKSVIRNRFFKLPKDVVMPHWLTPDPDPEKNPRPVYNRMAIVKNGILNLTDFENIKLRDIYPDLYNFALSPYYIDPNEPPEEPKEWYGWVEQWFDGDKDEIHEARKRAGFFVFSSDVSFPIIWQLYGPGGAGKTQYTLAIRLGRGIKNCLDTSPYGMGEEYGIADLPGKGLIIMDNAEWNACLNRSLYSQRANAIAGMTPVEIRRMRTQPFSITSNAHILIPTDRPCPYPDPGGQRERRIYYSRMPNHWAKNDPTSYGEPDITINKKIEKMMPGIIWHYFIPGYIDWLKEKGTIHLASSDVIREDLEIETQPLKAFFIDTFAQDKTKTKGWKFPTKVAWDNFRQWCVLNELISDETMYEKSFVRKLYNKRTFFTKEFSLQLGLKKEREKKCNDADRPWCYLDIKLKNDKA